MRPPITRSFSDPEGAGRLVAALQGGALAGPEIAAVFECGIERHRSGALPIVELTAARNGLEPQRAGAIFAATTHHAVWKTLLEDHGWTLDEVEDWMAETLAAQLLHPAASYDGAARPYQRTT